MALKHLIETFAAWKQAGDPLVLGTVYETAGSTYSKSGSRVLIDGEGNYQGLVSGGCLEGDLAEHAAAVLESGQARSVCYDMRGEHDILFGPRGLRRHAQGAVAAAVREGSNPWNRGADGGLRCSEHRAARRVEASAPVGQHLPGRRGCPPSTPPSRAEMPREGVTTNRSQAGAGATWTPVRWGVRRTAGRRVTVCAIALVPSAGDLVRPRPCASSGPRTSPSTSTWIPGRLRGQEPSLASTALPAALQSGPFPWIGVLGPKPARTAAAGTGRRRRRPARQTPRPRGPGHRRQRPGLDRAFDHGRTYGNVHEAHKRLNRSRFLIDTLQYPRV